MCPETHVEAVADDPSVGEARGLGCQPESDSGAPVVGHHYHGGRGCCLAAPPLGSAHAS